MNPARMFLESLDRRPGIREQPGSIAAEIDHSVPQKRKYRGHRRWSGSCQRRISSPRASTWQRWSVGQPGLSQSFFISREVFGTPIRAQHIFETGNT
jgi:hypothetical protein